jgi:hypothetical protein
MKKQLLTFFSIIFFAFQSFAQYTLPTPDGKTVQLNPNGTWQFVGSNKNKTAEANIPVKSTSKYTSKYKKLAVWYDPNEWKCDTSNSSFGEEWDATFTSKDQAINAYCLDSRLSMPTGELKNTIEEQWREIGKITNFQTSTDTINNLSFTRYDMLLEYGGVTYQYRGYIYTTLRGSFQLMIGTQKEVFEEDIMKIELFARGIIKL